MQQHTLQVFPSVIDNFRTSKHETTQSSNIQNFWLAMPEIISELPHAPGHSYKSKIHD
jgi:hypothetical protein